MLTKDESTKLSDLIAALLYKTDGEKNWHNLQSYIGRLTEESKTEIKNEKDILMILKMLLDVLNGLVDKCFGVKELSRSLQTARELLSKLEKGESHAN